MLPESFTFTPLQRRIVEASFSGGDITSDAGILLLREIDQQHGLTQQLADHLIDSRQEAKVKHEVIDLLRQRIYSLACGYEDLNDHDDLRHDLAMQTALNRATPLASRATLGRFEQQMDRKAVIDAHRVLWNRFISAHHKAPKRIILDFDATDIAVHGKQEKRFFHGYYDHYCFLPLYVFCGRHLLVSYLRPSNIDGAKHSWAILSLLVKFIRQYWPKTQIIMRADSGFCRHKMLTWMECHDVDYIIGIAKNSRLLEEVAYGLDIVKQYQELAQEKKVVFTRFLYSAHSWRTSRVILAKLEVTEKGPNSRFIISSLWQEDKRFLYRNLYCARGEMENRIKDQQLDLFAGRTSSPRWWTNQWRMLLSAFAWVLFEYLRKLLGRTELARASVNTLRLKLLKLGAVITRNTRRIRLMLYEAYPYKELFAGILNRLNFT